MILKTSSCSLDGLAVTVRKADDGGGLDIEM